MATATLKRTHGEAIGAADDSLTKQGAKAPKRTKNVKWKAFQSATQNLPTETAPPTQMTPKQQVAITSPPDDIAVQIVTGSYDRILHGITATIPSRLLAHDSSPASNGSEPAAQDEVPFTDTFLLAPHTASIRCLALSPPTDDTHKRLLATGGADERINLYSLSTKRPPKPNTKSFKSTPISIGSSVSSSNSLNRPLGSLTHHSRPPTTLSFPTKTKLFTSALDSTIAITRTRDWTLLSTIKAPIPVPSGRPSGDTAAPGEVPAGVNDFAIHPSQKLMLSVGQGERCLRLWNLMTGKRAGVLNFDRDVLVAAGEGRWSRGEGMTVIWFGGGEGFVVGFERGFVVFGVDCKVRAVVKMGTKAHRMRILGGDEQLLAVSTEDGRILFYDLKSAKEGDDAAAVPTIDCKAQLGGDVTGVSNRIKDFSILDIPAEYRMPDPQLIFVTANSNGAIRLWALHVGEIGKVKEEITQVGRLLATLETGNRITCLGAFIMDVEEVQGGGEVVEDGFNVEGSDSASEDDDAEENEFEGLDDA